VRAISRDSLQTLSAAGLGCDAPSERPFASIRSGIARSRLSPAGPESWDHGDRLGIWFGVWVKNASKSADEAPWGIH
jgi:hypothetical protein